ncbi:MAG TPA: hypothetical protein VIK01_04160, partial [Polyangiaceae bacterium]
GGNAQTLLRAKGSEDPRSPRQLLPELDPRLEDIVLHAIERSPRDRYSRAADMLADLADPARVTPRDRSEILGRKVGLVRRESLFSLGLALAILTLGSLVWLTHRRAPPKLPNVAPTEQRVR